MIMKKALFLLVIFICNLDCVTAQSDVSRSNYRDENGYEWVGLSSGEYKGVEDKNGKTIIPLSRHYILIVWDSNFKYYTCDKKINGKTYSGICDKWGKEIKSCSINGAIGYIGSRGFCYDDYSDGGRTKNLGVFLDSDNKAYRINNGTRIYISDGTNGISASSNSNGGGYSSGYSGGYNGGYSGGNYSSSSSSSSNSNKPQYTRTCGVCHGTGTCNNCGGKGWVSRIGMGKDGPCPVCPNHNGRCSSCSGRGSWKE